MLRDPKKAYKAKVPEFNGVISEEPDYIEVWNRARKKIEKTGLMPESRQREDLLNFLDERVE